MSFNQFGLKINDISELLGRHWSVINQFLKNPIIYERKKITLKVEEIDTS